jgi:hypothetical protein
MFCYEIRNCPREGTLRKPWVTRSCHFERSGIARLSGNSAESRNLLLFVLDLIRTSLRENLIIEILRGLLDTLWPAEIAPIILIRAKRQDSFSLSR